jgi:hypothetical protein
MHLKFACDVAQAMGSACAHATPLQAPGLDQYGHAVDQSVKDMFESFLALGPLYWLALLGVLWVVGKVFASIGSGLLMLIFRPRERG